MKVQVKFDGLGGGTLEASGSFSPTSGTYNLTFDFDPDIVMWLSQNSGKVANWWANPNTFNVGSYAEGYFYTTQGSGGSHNSWVYNNKTLTIHVDPSTSYEWVAFKMA